MVVLRAISGFQVAGTTPVGSQLAFAHHLVQPLAYTIAKYLAVSALIGSLSATSWAQPATPQPMPETTVVSTPETTAISPAQVHVDPAVSQAPQGISEPAGPPDNTQVRATGSSVETASPLETGLASWYGPRFHGRRTASGLRFNMHAMTAAHPTLPLLSFVKVTLHTTGHHILAQITDRGPHVKGRIIDLSKAAAQALGLLSQGLAQVTVEPVKTPSNQ